ncbi:hypothetical protein ACQ5SO_13345 [Rhodovulum sp. DZ06]|uniref:hypothetical protein n=1 Tax=Rhodovulum sp. DZ06 TaxID=3425126 RepID=UPI003D351E48
MRLVLLLALLPLPALAGEVEIVAAEAREGAGGWRFDVTLRHGDTGWDHYADAWRVLGPDGAVLGTRTLLHPHETEQPFTRALSGVRIPAGVSEVRIEARDSVHGWAPTTLTVALPGR